MRVTEKDVLYVADLANLELTPEERQRMAKDLNSILEYIDMLNKADTTNVAPMAQVFATDASGKASEPLREDALSTCLPHDAALSNAPQTDGDFFKVPRVIEK